jgi:hypothetical protein
MSATFDLDERLREVERTGWDNELKLTAHEDICAERYKGIQDKLDRMNRQITWAATGLIGGMAALLVKLLIFPGA